MYGNNKLVAKINIEKNKIVEQLLSANVNDQGIGLYDGLSGICVALGYSIESVESFKTDHLQNRINEILAITEEKIEIGENINYLYSTGISGWAWMLETLIQLNLVEKESIEIIRELDEAISIRLSFLLKQNHLDQLNGAIGLGRYFLRSGNVKAVELIIDFLDSTKINGADGIKWSRADIHNPDRYIYDFGLAHGIPGIIYFLKCCIEKGINIQLCKDLLSGAVTFIFNNLQEGVYGSYLPYEVDVIDYNLSESKKERSRLSWCYGDLGAFYAIYNACEILEEYDLKKRVLNILIKTTERKAIEVTQIEDAGFCHGTSGVAYIYLKLWRTTGKQVFKEASDYWIIQTMEFGNLNEKGNYRFLVYKQGIGKELIECSNLLLGLSGVMLVYLSFLDPELTEWDECMMLN